MKATFVWLGLVNIALLPLGIMLIGSGYANAQVTTDGTLNTIDDRAWDDIRDISAFRQPRVVAVQAPTLTPSLVQATGWYRNAEGKIKLVANQSPVPVQPSLTCAAVPRS